LCSRSRRQAMSAGDDHSCAGRVGQRSSTGSGCCVAADAILKRSGSTTHRAMKGSATRGAAQQHYAAKAEVRLRGCARCDQAGPDPISGAMTQPPWPVGLTPSLAAVTCATPEWAENASEAKMPRTPVGVRSRTLLSASAREHTSQAASGVARTVASPARGRPPDASRMRPDRSRLSRQAAARRLSHRGYVRMLRTSPNAATAPTPETSRRASNAAPTTAARASREGEAADRTRAVNHDPGPPEREIECDEESEGDACALRCTKARSRIAAGSSCRRTS